MRKLWNSFLKLLSSPETTTKQFFDLIKNMDPVFFHEALIAIEKERDYKFVTLVLDEGNPS